MNQKLPEYFYKPEVMDLIREGFEAYADGKSSSETPHTPSFSNGWWQHGWLAAAIAAEMKLR